MTAWRDVVKGDMLTLGGAPWAVAKIKGDGKTRTVTVERQPDGLRIKQEVRAKDAAPLRTEPLHGKSGEQKRWAKPAETVEAGDQQQTKPPRPAVGNPWDTPADRVEKKLDQILGARLVGEGTAAGYYVPPVDVSTVAAHLIMFHSKDFGASERIRDLGIDDMLELHDNEHAAALKGYPLPINHWHTEVRPGA